jgi:ABC-type glycerol-3-phosphate transport system permease component
MKTNRHSRLWHVPLMLVGLTMLLPLVFMISTALAEPGQAMRATDSLWELLIPTSWRWENFVEVTRVVPFGRYYLNSLFVAGIGTAVHVFTSACAAYAFSRLVWRGRDTVFLAYLATIMVPGAVTMLPNFAAMKMLPDFMEALVPWVNWEAIRVLGSQQGDPLVGRLVGLDSYFALTVPAMFSAYGTFMLRQFFISLPKEIDEAAEIDGCSHWQAFMRIILPLALPALATLTIFTFMGIWGSFMWPLVVVNHSQLQTLPVALLAFQGQYGTEWHLMMAAALPMLVPIVALYLAGQRFFVSGLTIGAVKG